MIKVDLVFVKDDRVLTSSLIIAERFGKKHSLLIKDISGLLNNMSELKGAIAETKYCGTPCPVYLIDLSGFFFVATAHPDTKAVMDFLNAFSEGLKMLAVPSHAQVFVNWIKSNIRSLEHALQRGTM